MNKVTFMVFFLLLFLNINFVSADSLEGEVSYIVCWVGVSSEDGTYSDDLFIVRRDRSQYKGELKRLLLADFYYQGERRELNTELELSNELFKVPKLDKYLFNIKRENFFNIEVGNKLEPQLPHYLFSLSEDDYTTGLVAQLQWRDIKFRPLYLREDKDLENFQQEVEVYGMVSELTSFADFDFVLSVLRAVPTGELLTGQVRSQSNYLLELEEKSLEWLEVKVDLARSETDDSEFTEEVIGNLAVLNLEFALTSDMNTEFKYSVVNELYAPLRDIEYKKGYAFRETDYKRGYEINSDYRLPLELNTMLELKHGNFYRTNSYLQSLEEYRGVEDDKIRNYQLGLVTESGRSYSRLFFTRERTTNETDINDENISLPPSEKDIEEGVENNYNPGYKDITTNVIHLYGRYNLLMAEEYNLNFDGRYVYERIDNKYHSYRANLSSEIKEATFILGANGSYYLRPKLRTDFNYIVEYKNVIFSIDEEIYSKARLHRPSFVVSYQWRDDTELKLDYQYQNYKLLDHKPGEGGEVYRYYDQDFTTHKVSAKINLKF